MITSHYIGTVNLGFSNSWPSPPGARVNSSPKAASEAMEARAWSWLDNYERSLALSARILGFGDAEGLLRLTLLLLRRHR